MIFDRYRRGKRREDAVPPTPIKSNLATAFFRKLPFMLSRRAWPTHPASGEVNGLAPCPRPSVSLPTHALASPAPGSMVSSCTLHVPAPRHAHSSSTLRFLYEKSGAVTKRHSADQVLLIHTHRGPTIVKKPQQIAEKRHSYTFGRPNARSVSREDLVRARKDVMGLHKTPALTILEREPLSTHLLAPPPPPIQSEPRKPLLRAQSAACLSTSFSCYASMTPAELIRRLEQKEPTGLIDVRSLVEFQKSRINGSVNVNLPSLLVKRCQRGTVSNFHLDNFITTPDGRERYQSWVNAAPMLWVVYDDDMPTSSTDQITPAWTLVKVLARLHGDDHVQFLEGGFRAFETIGSHIDVGEDDNTLLDATQVYPRRSVSYTIGSSDHDSPRQRRTSLFSLDTQAAKVNNANALARRARRRDNQHLMPPETPMTSTLTTAPLLSSAKPSLTEVAEDEEMSPRTETDYEFAISEIIPGCLYVGPEIETAEQAEQLEARKIRRVLNMAEECHDKAGLGNRGLVYSKIATRDTVEMVNVERMIRDAVRCIEDAKRYHDPIYVHCKVGKSRSITAVLAYLVSSERWTLKQAYSHVIKARPNMSPNIGFIAELMKLESRVHGRVSNFMNSDWQTASTPNPDTARIVEQVRQAWQVQV